jgi:hypothetical protein
MASDTASHTLSGWPSVTDSEVKSNFSIFDSLSMKFLKNETNLSTYLGKDSILPKSTFNNNYIAVFVLFHGQFTSFNFVTTVKNIEFRFFNNYN